ncbi:MAG TPA: glycosyltransferase family 4 protein [Myxococcaceae bacterium]
MPRRLLSLSHSYVVALNRRLAVELARAGGDAWEVTAVAPRFFHGDLRPIALEPDPGSSLEVVGLRAWGSRFKHAFVYGLELRDVLRRPCDVLHCWEEPFVLAGAQVAAWAPRSTRLVYATYQNIPKRYPPPFGALERLALGRAAGWVAGGATVVQALQDRPGYRDRPHAQIPMGVDVDAFQPDAAAGKATRAELGWAADGPPVVGFVSRFVEEKGCGLLLRALDRAAAPWRALFLGDGPLRPELDAWAKRHGDRVRVVPPARHAEVPRYLNAIDLLCVPSQTTRRWREQFGRILIEAFACGRAVLASDSGEIPHTVGDAAVVVPESNVGAWTAALDRLLASERERAELSGRGLARAREHFAWPVVARRYLEFFDQLCDGTRA